MDADQSSKDVMWGRSETYQVASLSSCAKVSARSRTRVHSLSREKDFGERQRSSCRVEIDWLRTMWTTCVTLTLLLECTRAADVDVTIDRRDFRFTSYRALIRQSPRFQHDNIVGYTQLVLDEFRNQVIVGGKDVLFRLSLDDLRVLEKADWTSTNETMERCSSTGQTEENCHNFVRVLLLHKDDMLFACGTNAFDPTCTWRPASHITDINETIPGKAIIPYDPRHNTTALMTSNGDLYTATIIDILARDPSINRKLGPSVSLRTEQSNSKWLNEPNFVSTYEFGNFVYFFFRETAVEYINCGKTVYSRVARVCKTDKGGTIFLEGRWTSFHKARMNCSLPGDFPFYFNEIQSTFYYNGEHDEKLLYAVFTTPANSIAGSAVCVYNMTSFEKAFNGPFKYQENAMSAWLRHENGVIDTRKCSSESGGSKRSPDGRMANHVEMAQKYQLMDQAVQPITFSPLVMREHERWTHLVVDYVKNKTDHVFEMFFLATDDGKVKKIMRLPNSNVTCLVEEIKIVPNGHPRPVKAMKLSASKGAIYISTDGNVLKVSVENCNRFTESSMCLAARDPYCGWDNVQGKCTVRPIEVSQERAWQQDISACPDLNYAEDGGWSEWAPWSKCPQIEGDPVVDFCQCRSRSCDNPKPSNGGSPCFGASIQVSNCTIHGQWTEWSEWSACSQTCGYGTRFRKRHCGNPAPKYGGRLCEGEATDKDYCDENSECPLTPVDGNWAVWSGWSSCTQQCNGGIMIRRRNCSQPAPSRGGNLCVGNTEEYRMCNTQECTEISRISPWTEWIQTNRTTGGYFEQRFRFTCRANVPNPKMIKTTYAKSQARFCQNNGHGCQTADLAEEIITTDDRDGGWSNWTEWSECSSVCGRGLQWRNRTCDDPSPTGFGADCDGHQREGRECNTQWECDDACNTGQWSAWSPCTGNVQYRHKVQTANNGSSLICSQYLELQSCNTSVDHLQKNSDPQTGASTAQDQGSLHHLGILYLIVVGIISFILGGAACVGVYLYIQHSRIHRRRQVSLWTTDVSCTDNPPILLKSMNSHESLEMRLFNNTKELNKFDAFGSLRAGTVTVNETSTLLKNSMRTNLSSNDL